MDLISGTTCHTRAGPVQNVFRYGVDYVMCDAEVALAPPWLFSRNRRNVMSLWDTDHGGDRQAGQGAAWVRGLLKQAPLDRITPARIALLAQPRVFGHVFNPVSFWLVFDAADDLRLVVAEVNNTFGQRHCYLCYKDDLSPIGPRDRIGARKVFHVSPFQDVAGDYTFRFDFRDGRVGIVIDFRHPGGQVLASFHGRRQRLSSWAILRAMARRPFGSRRVLALIHWQALKLWWRGAVYRDVPPEPRESVSR